MNIAAIEKIRRVARGIRRRALELTLLKDGCYLSQALSSADIIATLYVELMNIGPSIAPRVPPRFPGVPRPGHHYLGADYNGERTPDRDRLLLSAAHYAVAIYSALVETGRMDAAGLDEFNTDGSTVEMIGAEHSPGMELTTGSFGQALSQAGGIALARKLRKETGRVWVFMSDGEWEEGQTYEALQAATFHKLDNITVLVDVNGMQVDGATKDVIGVEPLHLAERASGFGAQVEVVNGHDIEAIVAATRVPHPDKPLVIFCQTNSAQGVPLLEPRKPFIHYIRFKNAEDKAQFAAFAKEM